MSIKYLVGLILVILFTVACSEGQSADKYFEEVAALDAATNATEQWTVMVERDARIDSRTLSRSQALMMVEAQLSAARHAYETSNEAINALMQATPPQQCEDAHIVTLEALQLTERAFLELTRWLESGLGGGSVNDDSRIRGNDLLNEADMVKQRGINDALDCK